MRGTFAAPRSYPLRWLLAAYGLVVAVPLLALLGLFYLRASSLERQAVEQRLIVAAGDLADNIDRDIERRLTTLRVLASMPSLAARDWATFYDRAKAALRDEVYVIVIDRELRQLVNTYVAYSAQPPLTGDPETARRVLATGEPAVSDLFISMVTKGPVYNILLPIKESGRVELILILGIKTDDLVPILGGQQLADGWFSSVWDNNDVVVARSQRPELVGSKLPVHLSRSAIGESGLIRTDSIGGEGLVWRAFVSSRLTGWRVSVAAPMALVEGPLQASARMWGGLSLAVSVLSLLFGAFIARLLTASFGRLKDAAVAVGDNKPLPLLPEWSVTEAATVRKVLEDSHKEIDRREQLLREGKERLERLIHSTTDAVISIDQDQRIVLFNPSAEEAFACRAADAVGSSIDRFIPEPMRQVHRDHVRKFGETGVTGRRMGALGALMAVRANGQEFPIEASISQVTVGGGKLYTAIIRDITERRQAEANQQFLMRELAHRMKNQLAVIQAMAGQTARSAASLKEFQQQFAQRVQGLAVSTDLLVVGGWTGTRLAELIEHQLESFNPGGGRLKSSGPNVWISVDATQTISLALHELATNSVKYGAWSVAEGTVTVSWQIDASGPGAPCLRLSWLEHGGPAVAPPTRRGFGHVVIESMAAHKIGGEARLLFAPEGLSWTLTVPTAHFDANYAERGGGGTAFDCRSATHVGILTKPDRR